MKNGRWGAPVESVAHPLHKGLKIGRGERIRTSDPLTPSQVR